ncbi:MAG: sigma-54 interaction domain-containing protein [bacterium]
MSKNGIESLNSFATGCQSRQAVFKPNQRDSSPLSAQYRSEFMIGKSRAMQEVFRVMDSASQNGCTVLITGETGTGKDLVARQLHQRSPRAEFPFVVVDCAAIPRELMENELFGHEKGAFTGAFKRAPGKLEIAGAGTVFFDDINCMPRELQAKLLRVLQEKNFERVGGTKTVVANCRFIFATNQDLKEEVRRGNFREDLYYRIYVFPIDLPPLRDRKEDIPLLANHFVKKSCLEQDKPVKKLTQKTMSYLLSYSWPGNVRELENEIERIVSLLPREVENITHDLLSDNVLQCKHGSDGQAGKGRLNEAVEALEKDLLCQALRKFKGNKTAAAKYLGLSRRGIDKKLVRYRMGNADCLSRN